MGAVDADVLVCSKCSREFLAQHCRSAHPEQYHLEDVPQPHKKAHWDQEELFILARTELTLRRSGVRYINQALAMVMAGDGVADSIWLLKTIIHQHQQSLTPLNIAFLDVKKAFDSVSHQSLILATKRMGIPPPMLVYLQELYGDVSTSLQIGPDRSEPIGVSQGVRQGDPLSVHLFNACSHRLGPSNIRTRARGDGRELRVNAGAFADDIALIARTSRGLQSLLDDLSSELRPSGLEISMGLDGKSASL